jgi:hypothetical protein
LHAPPENASDHSEEVPLHTIFLMGGRMEAHPGQEATADRRRVKGLRAEYTRTIEPARALAAETLTLERMLSDLVNQAYGLTPAEIELMWKTAPPRMPIPPPSGF